LRVVMVTDSFKPRIGGIESVVCDLARTLSRSMEVYVVTTSKTARSIYVYEDGVGYVTIKIRSNILNYNGVTLNPSAGVALYKLLRSIDPDVVHGHGTYSTLSIAGALLGSKIAKRASLVTAHSFIGRDTPRYIVEGLEAALKSVDIVTAVSRAVAEDLVRRLKLRRVAVAYNCLIAGEWRRREDEALELEGDPVVSSVIRFTYRKNPLALVRVAEALAREAPKAKLYIAGDGPLRKPLESRVKARGLKNTVFLGALSRENVKRLLWASDVFVLPSKVEAFGISALEAMASRVPVVAFRAGGIPEVVVDGVTGLLAGSEEELARLTVELSLDRDLARRLGLNAELRAREFDCEVIASRYTLIYRMLLSERCRCKA